MITHTKLPILTNEKPREARRTTINVKLILTIAISLLIITGFVILFNSEQGIVYRDTISHTESGVPYNVLIYNGEELTDHRYIIGEELCVAENLGMEISIYPCNTKVFIGEDIENYVDFTWTGGVAQDTSWVFVYEGTLESGEMTLGHDEVQQYTVYEMQERWVYDYMVSGVTDYVDISPPTIESCELGTENNSMMYQITQQNSSGTFEKTYCFSEVQLINETTYSISGNASLSTAVQRERTITIYDTPIAVDYLGQDLLGNGFQYYQVLDVSFEPDQTYKTKWRFTPQDHALSGKWHIFGYDSQYSIEESLDLEQYIYVDPSWTSNFNLGLVAYYMMNDTTGNGTDAVFADNNVTVFNETVNRGLTGILNGSYQFGGTPGDFADVTDIASMNSTTGTFAFWFNWTNFTLNLQYALRFADETVGNQLYAVFDTRVGNPILTICANIGGGACDWRIDIKTANISEGTWQHLAVTQNGTGGNLYINGTLLATSTGADHTVWIRDLMNAGGINKLRLGADYDGLRPWRGHLDEMAIWNRSLTVSEVSDLYNGGAGFFYDPDAGFPFAENITVALDLPLNNTGISSTIINFTATLTPTDINNTNATLYIWNATELISNNITNLVTGAVANQTNFSIENFDVGQHTWNVFGCGNSSNNTIYCEFADNRSFTFQSFSVDGQSFNNIVSETDSELFFINLTTIPSVLSLSAILNYNGTQHSNSNVLCISGECEINITIDIPLTAGGAEEENKTFLWEISVFDGTSTIRENTTTLEQNVTRIHLEQCDATFTVPALNFTVFNEQSDARISPFYIAGTFDIWLGSGTTTRNNTFSNLTAAEFPLCIDPPDKNFTTNANIEYNEIINSSDFNTRNYFFQNDIINNITQHIRLFLLDVDDSTSFILKVQDTNLLPIAGAIIITERLNVGTGEFVIVQIARTDDNGQTVGFFKTETVDYRFIIKKNGVILLQTGAQKVIPETAPFTLTFTIGVDEGAPWTQFEDLPNLTKTLEFNSSNGIVTFTYVDTSGEFTSSRLLVTLTNLSGFSPTVCDVNSTISTAILTCDTGNITGSYTASAFVTRGSDIFLVVKIIFTIATFASVVGLLGVFLAWFIILISAFALKFNEIAGIVLINLTTIFVNMIGLVSFGYLFIFSLMGVSIIIIILLKK